MAEVITAGLVLVGSLFMFLAALGIARLPDLFSRMQAATKAAVLGAACMLLAVAVHFGEVSVVSRSVATIAFICLTAPVAAHMIGRAGYTIGVPLWEGTIVDELRGQYDPDRQETDSDPSETNP